jgi:hypothetical protein
MNNSVNKMIDVLRKKPFLTENEITWAAFDYDRNTSRHSNKKYADMLRRGLTKGIIKRVEANVKGKRAKFFYYIPGQEDLEFGKQKTDSYIIEPLEITGIPNGDTMSDTDDEEIGDIPGFEGVLAALDNLTSEFRTYIGAPGNEIG